MKKNYWQECWENYYKFMGVYLRMLQNAYPDMDFTNEYVKVANLIAPSMPIEGLEDYNEYNNNGNFNYPEIDNNSPYILPNEGQSPNPFTSPNGGQSPNPFTSPSNGQSPNPFSAPGNGQSPNPFSAPSGGQSPASFSAPNNEQSPTPFISPGGGQFTINNCKKMAVVRIEMRRGFNPSNFFMLVDSSDRRSIQGFRIACESGRIRFIPMSVEYRNINLIECAF
ncbi:MAG TPA: hypothetical protein K8V90_06985 [Romboutsia timonensis]|uniref:Uncharacterized protein n=1 Tax=Romboutsia timonensis TaxID=1776391 RepID=A0A921N0Q9_9FIRM|nr:hypothetical protein [uncultured Romboutsia sp.]HJG96827.1 hypothetical protein [Romboutsia timonensis]